MVDLRVPSELFVGYGEVVVTVDGRPGEGQIDFWGPSGVSERSLNGGSINYYFSEPGVWQVVYGNSSEDVLVKEKPSPSVAAPAAQEPSRETGLFYAFLAPWQWLLLLAALLLLGWLAYENWWRSVRLEFKYENGKAEYRVVNRKADLTGVELLVLLPEGARASNAEGEPVERETINGFTLKWRRAALARNETWVVRFECASKPVRAELKAECNGAEVRASA